MTTLTFYGGVGEIWGNKILLADNENRVFLDLGMKYENYQSYGRKEYEV
ncbi:MAG: hypothetical protein WBC40_01880 [Halobacteriota archaeon]